MIYIYSNWEKFYENVKKFYPGFSPSEGYVWRARRSKYIYFETEPFFSWCHIDGRCKYCDKCNVYKETFLREEKLRRILNEKV